MSTAMNSPTGIDLFPEPPSVRRFSKRIVILVAAVVTALLIMVIYGVYGRSQRRPRNPGDPGVTKVEPAISAGHVVAADVPLGNVPMEKPARTENKVLPPANAPAPMNVTPPVSASVAAVSPVEPTPAERRQQLLEEQQQRAMEAATGIGSSFGVPSSNTSATGQAPSAVGFGSSPQLDALSGSALAHALKAATSHDADRGSAQTDKEAFITQARREKPASENYVHSTRVAPLTKYVINAGWDIPAIIQQGLNSDLPGEIRARVRQNVYDSATGKYVLIPHDSILVGSYDPNVSYGQTRLQVVWDRINFPDASSVNLEGMIGQDVGGASGITWKVNHHYVRMAAFGVLTSLFSAGFQLSQPRQGSTVFQTPSTGQVVAGAVGQNLAQLGAEVTRKNLNIPPTITVPAGFEFNVRVNRDLVFSSPYKPL